VTLTAEKVIAADVILDCIGALTLAASGLAQGVFTVTAGTTAELRRMTLENVEDDYGSGFGGCVLNEGTLTLVNVLVRNCFAGVGGGVYNSGTLTIVDSTIAGNDGNDGG